MLKSVKLVSVGHEGLGYGDADWNFDANGNLETIQGKEAVVQNVVKMIHTELQPWGYGTVLHDLIGQKNTSIARAMAIYTVKRGLAFLAWIRDQHTSIQAMENEERLKRELSVIADPVVPSDQRMYIRCKIETADNTASDVNTEIGG